MSCVITVVDTGPGIAADHLPHVFERYWKARPASQVGAGLGLYIAKGIVEAHGGRIWAESSNSRRQVDLHSAPHTLRFSENRAALLRSPTVGMWDYYEFFSEKIRTE